MPEDRPESGPIQGLDKYKEGYCFKVPNGVQPREIWLICLEEQEKARTFMESFMQAKIMNQHENGETYSVMPESDDPTAPGFKNEDGSYWKIIKDWGECSVACGGGLQYQQLMCIKPSTEAMDCLGESTRTRECNNIPCPTAGLGTGQEKSEEEKAIDYAKSQVHFLPISNKPQRYDKCVIMERDALITKDEDPEDKFNYKKPEEPQQIPARLVMNTKSIVAYLDDNYGTPYKIFDLPSTTLLRKSTESPSGEKVLSTQCFILKDGRGTRSEVCQLDCTVSGEAFIDEWNREIQIFQQECQGKRTVVDVDLEFEQKVSELKAKLQKKQAEKVQEEATNQEILKLHTRKKEAEIVSLLALQKEKKLEELLEREEEAREQQEIHELEAQMEDEKKKTGCLIESLKHEEISEKLTVANTQVESQVDNIKSKAQEQLDKMRQKTQAKIEQKKRMHERNVQELKAKIQSIRIQTATNLKKIGYNGDANNCFIGTPEKELEIEAYCTKAYMDDADKLMDCKRLDSFCYACCEYEFGEGHNSKREECYRTQCEDITIKENDQFMGLKGRDW